MAYTPNTWQPRIVQFPTRFNDQNGNIYNFTPSPGTVTQPGTAFSAEWMNHIETGIAGVYATIQEVNVLASGWNATPNMPMATTAQYDDTSGVYTLTMPDGWSFSSGSTIAFTVPAAPGSVSSVSIAIGSLSFPFASVPTWTQDQVVSVELLFDSGTSAYSASESATPYETGAPYTQTIAGITLSPTQRADLYADVTTLGMIASAIVPVNESGTLVLQTLEPPEQDIPVQIALTDTQGVI